MYTCPKGMLYKEVGFIWGVTHEKQYIPHYFQQRSSVGSPAATGGSGQTNGSLKCTQIKAGFTLKVQNTSVVYIWNMSFVWSISDL